MLDALVPIIRAAVQAGVGAVLAFLLVWGVPVPPGAEVPLVLALTGLLTGLLAKGQQALERRYPALGALLRTPEYPERPLTPNELAEIKAHLRRELGIGSFDLEPPSHN